MKKLIAMTFAVLGVTAMGLNLYGMTRTLAPQGIATEHLRFSDSDVRIDKLTFKNAVNRTESESDSEYAQRLTNTIADGIAHIHWEDYDPDRFHQRVPIWENYILYTMGVLLPIPEYQRYHFVSPEKSIERGIGICGDASMLLSQLLDRQNIANKIITVPGHVMVEADFGERKQLLDPDFGVVLEGAVNDYYENPRKLQKEYMQEGYINNGEIAVMQGFQQGYTVWNGTSHFITKKYYFEKVSYWLKWILPVLALFISAMILRSKTK